MFKPLFKYFIIITLISVFSACSGSIEEPTINKPTKPVVILIFGDSISQGYGIDIYGYYFQQVTPGNTYTELLRTRLKNEKIDEFATIAVLNDSLGGEKTNDALVRLPSVLAYHRPTHIVFAHGTNDVGAGVPLQTISNNFLAMINMARGSGASVLLADVTPSVFGPSFADQYSKMVNDTAKQTGVTYVPLLQNVFGNASYYYPDGVHVRDSAQSILLDNLWGKLIPALRY